MNDCWVVVSKDSWVGDTSTGLTAAVTVKETDVETPIEFVAFTVNTVATKLVLAGSVTSSPESDGASMAFGMSGVTFQVTPPVYPVVC